jgi:hypothetical protein
VAPGGGSTGGAGAGSGSLVHEFNLVCAGGAVDNCVPACSAALRGDLLLMNLNGEDSKYHLHVPLNHDQKSGLTEECLCLAMPILILLAWSRYSCELHHGLHSWVGAATDGGYLGSDARAFVSAVLSGAAGYYALALDANAVVAVDVVIHPGQDVHISGGGRASPTWGDGSFTVQQGGSLSLEGVELAGGLVVQRGGTMSIDDSIVRGDITVETNGTLHLSNVRMSAQHGQRSNHGQLLAMTGATVSTQGLIVTQCSAPYITLSDAGCAHRW